MVCVNAVLGSWSPRHPLHVGKSRPVSPITSLAQVAIHNKSLLLLTISLIGATLETHRLRECLPT